MSLRKIVRWFLMLIVAGILGYALQYAWQAFPIISAYGAKTLCSCTMLAGRSEADVIANELGNGLLRLGNYRADFSDSSAYGSVFGMAKRKAIYRKGLGCTLINEISENDLRSQPLRLAAIPSVNPDTILWPAGDKLPEVDLSNYNMDQLHQIADSLFYEPGKEKLRRTRAFLVVHNGNIIIERYAEGFNHKSRLMGWSMTKSLTNGIIGILIKEGILHLNQSDLLDNWKNDERSAIKLDNLMQASSGLYWEEVYSGPSTTTNMLFKKKDAGLYAARFPLQFPPGEVFYYSSGTTNILSHIARQAVGDEDYPAFAYRELFHKIGMYSLVIEPDPGGTFVGSSFSWATTRDWARFGLLYLNDGFWLGERILPEGWVEYSVTPARGAKRGEYGAQFWLNAGEPGNPKNREFPDVPEDMFYMSGYEDQYVFIIPSENLLVVRLGLTTGYFPDYNRLLKDLIRALPH